MLETVLQNFLSDNNGRNLSLIDPSLLFVQTEYVFKGGRIDILAIKNGLPVALELKTNKYSSSQVAGQIINYLNFLESRKGEVYFVAPKINDGVISTLRPWKDRLHFYEFYLKDNRYIFFEEQDVFSLHRYSAKKNSSNPLSLAKMNLFDKALYDYVRKPLADKATSVAKKLLGL